MEHWGFVSLAYGIVWATLILYITILKRRLRKVEAELKLHRSSGNPDNEEK
ncbi:MAG: CcmD family protein [Candidatus Binatia bacterium]